MPRVASICAALLLLPSAASAQALLFKCSAGHVFDGEALRSADVRVESGRIVAVRDHLPADGARVVECAGRTLLPGFIDAHTHVDDEPTKGKADLERALVFGVTTELDMFSLPAFVATVRAREAAGEFTGMSDMRSAGILATAPGGHGTEFGLTIPTLTRPEEAAAFVAARVAEGSDYIKLVYDHSTAWGTSPTLRKDTLRALIDAAHRSLRTMPSWT